MNTLNTSTALFTIAPAIAAALPGSWSALPLSPESRVCNFYLARADGLTLFLAGNGGGLAKSGRLFLQHSRPRSNGKWVELWENYNTVKAPEMTVADTKTAEKIAADIVARLLPEAERIDRLAREKIAASNDYAARKRATLEKVSAAAGDEMKMQRGTNEPCFDGRAGEGVTFQVESPGCVIFTVRTNEEQALALLAFLKSPAFAGIATAKE